LTVGLFIEIFSRKMKPVAKPKQANDNANDLR